MVDLSPETDNDAKSTCTSIVTVPASIVTMPARAPGISQEGAQRREGSERRQWRSTMELYTRTELQEIGMDLGLKEETTRIMNYSNSIQEELIELILNHKSKAKDDAGKKEQDSWSDVTSRSKRKPETRSNTLRSGLNPRRTNTQNDSQRRVAAKRGPRKSSREDRPRR